MVAPEKGGEIGYVFAAMGELGFRTDSVEAQGGVPGEGAEADNDLRVKQREFAGGVGEAPVSFGGSGFVAWRGATDGGGDPKPAEAQAVTGVPGDRLVRVAGTVE